MATCCSNDCMLCACVCAAFSALLLILTGAHLSESAFNIPIPNSERDHWELVQRGLVTPFDSTITQSHSTSSSSSSSSSSPSGHFEQEVKDCTQDNEGEGSAMLGENDCALWSSERPEAKHDAEVSDGNGDGFPLMGMIEPPLSDGSGNAGDGSMEAAVMKASLSPVAEGLHVCDTGLTEAGHLYVTSDHTSEMEDIPSAEEGEEEDYVPDGLEWSAEESSDYSSVEEGSEGGEEEAMEKEIEGEESLVWKEGRETGVTRVRPRKRLPKHLDDGDISLYQTRIR